MISPVSFGSTYKLTMPAPSCASQNEILHAQCYSEKYPIETVHSYVKDPNKPEGIIFAVKATVVVPDEEDIFFENFCVHRGISFKRYNTEDFMTESSIKSRVWEPLREDMRKVYVSPDSIYNLIKTQNGNIKHCESDYRTYYKKKLDFMLKSGNEIPASTLYLTPISGKKEMLDYINVFGAENINPESLMVDFSKRTSEPDHLMFFAMADAGLTEIPVYVDDDSYEIGKALGILK